MLSSRGDGKYLTKRWAKDRAAAIIDPDSFTAAELSYLEVTERKSAKDGESYQAEKRSFNDSYPGTYDIRTEKKRGGR